MSGLATRSLHFQSTEGIDNSEAKRTEIECGTNISENAASIDMEQVLWIISTLYILDI